MYFLLHHVSMMYCIAGRWYYSPASCHSSVTGEEETPELDSGETTTMTQQLITETKCVFSSIICSISNIMTECVYYRCISKHSYEVLFMLKIKSLKQIIENN